MFRSIVGLITALLVAPSVQAASVQPPLPPVEDYGKLPAVEMMRLSSSGDRYAFVAEVDGRRRVLVATIDNKLLEEKDVGDVKVRNLEWAGDDHLLVTTSSTVDLGVEFTMFKSELYSVSVINLATHKVFAVFGPDNNEHVANTVAGEYGVAQIAGRWFGFFGGYTYEDGRLKMDSDHRLYKDLYRVDLDTGAFEEAATDQPDASGWLVDANGKVVARSLYNYRNGDWSIVASSHSRSPLASGRAKFGGARILGFGKTPDSLLVQIPSDDGISYQDIPLSGASPTVVATDQSAQGVLTESPSHLWIGLVQEDDNRAATLFDPAREAKLSALYKAFPGYIAHIVSYSTDFNHIIVRTDGGDDSGTFWIVNIVGGKGEADVLGSVYPTIVPAFVGPVRMIDYRAADGLALRGVLTLPPGRTAKGLPLVVIPHGGPAVRDYPGFDYWAQAFAARGYAVFQPNFRGSSGYGVKFRNAGFDEWGRKMQTDISDGVAVLAAQGLVDPKRVCIVGASYGGYAALAGVTVQQNLYRCAVSVGGVADLPRFLDFARERAGGVDASTRWLTAFLGVKSFWETELHAISPKDLAKQADAPILLIHGKDDTVVLIDQSQAMDRALKAAGKPVEFVTLPGADHWLLEQDARVAMLKASVAFVMKYDPPDPAPTDLAAK